MSHHPFFQENSMRQNTRKVTTTLLLSMLLAGTSGSPVFADGFGFPKGRGEPRTATPIKHLVIIFGENISFDHYFGTYPKATNPQGEPYFRAHPNTPRVNGYTFALLNNNPNLNTANGAGAGNPFRLDRSQANTADQNHAYRAAGL